MYQKILQAVHLIGSAVVVAGHSLGCLLWLDHQWCRVSRLFVCNFVVLWALSTALKFLNNGETAPFYDYYQEIGQEFTIFELLCDLFTWWKLGLSQLLAACYVFSRYNVLDLRFSVSLFQTYTYCWKSKDMQRLFTLSKFWPDKIAQSPDTKLELTGETHKMRDFLQVFKNWWIEVKLPVKLYAWNLFKIF